MHVFKLSMTAGAACTAAAEGTTLNGAVLVDNDDVQLARDGALLALDRLGFECCTFLDAVRLPPAPDTARYSGPMKQAYEDAKRDGVAVMLYAAENAG